MEQLFWKKLSKEVATEKGVYIWLYRSLGNAPFYVGTAAKAGFGNRFAKHGRNYRDGLYTFFRSEILKTEFGDGSHFDYALAIASADHNSKNGKLFTPGKLASTDSDLKEESELLWTKHIVKLVCVLDPKENDIKMIESKLQYDLEDYYTKLLKKNWPDEASDFRAPDFKVPNSKVAKFFGKREIPNRAVVEDIDLKHQLNGKSFESSADFFSALADEIF